ncbi:MAG: molybdopterin-dependent oxidoreductase [Smithella sp.]
MNRTVPEIFKRPQGSLIELDQNDIILLIGANPLVDQPVASYIIKRACDRGAHLIIIDEKENGLSPFAYMIFNYNEMDKAIDIVNRAAHPVILYGVDIPAAAKDDLKKINDQASFIALEQGVNTSAAAAMKLNNEFNSSPVKFLYVLAGEQDYGNVDFLKGIPKEAFVAVQASYVSPLLERADLVLPAAIWSEQSGTLTNTEGRIQKLQKAIEPVGEAKADWETLFLLAEQLGKKIDMSIDEIPSYITRLVNERRS